mmetsp:Transcript_79878/g.222447  ORF Transcript_79878/g.222447 Transcript_79878/m.222447 type:complete len:210 (-) Transcript_79878:217-846(-)
MDRLLEPRETLLQLALHVRIPARGASDDSVGLDRGHHLQKLTGELLMSPPAFLELLEALRLQVIFEVAETRPQFFKRVRRLFDGPLLPNNTLLEGRQTHQWLRVARARVWVVLHGLDPLRLVDMDCWIELGSVGLLEQLRVVREGIRISDKALLQRRVGRDCSRRSIPRRALQYWVKFLHALRKLHAQLRRVDLRVARAQAPGAHAHGA